MSFALSFSFLLFSLILSTINGLNENETSIATIDKYLKSFVDENYNRCYLSTKQWNTLCIKSDHQQQPKTIEINYENNTYYLNRNEIQLSDCQHNNNSRSKLSLCPSSHGGIQINFETKDSNETFLFSRRRLFFHKLKNMFDVILDFFSAGNLLDLLTMIPQVFNHIKNAHIRGFNSVKPVLYRMLQKEKIHITAQKMMSIAESFLTDPGVATSAVILAISVGTAIPEIPATFGASLLKCIPPALDFIKKIAPIVFDAIGHIMAHGSNIKRVLVTIANFIRGLDIGAIGGKIVVKVSEIIMPHIIRQLYKNADLIPGRRLMISNDYDYYDYFNDYVDDYNAIDDIDYDNYYNYIEYDNDNDNDNNNEQYTEYYLDEFDEYIYNEEFSKILLTSQFSNTDEENEFFIDVLDSIIDNVDNDEYMYELLRVAALENNDEIIGNLLGGVKKWGQKIGKRIQKLAEDMKEKMLSKNPLFMYFKKKLDMLGGIQGFMEQIRHFIHIFRKHVLNGNNFKKLIFECIDDLIGMQYELIKDVLEGVEAVDNDKDNVESGTLKGLVEGSSNGLKKFMPKLLNKMTEIMGATTKFGRVLKEMANDMSQVGITHLTRIMKDIIDVTSDTQGGLDAQARNEGH